MFFKRKKPGRRSDPIVQVDYRELDEEPEFDYGYAYRWPFDEDPDIGDRVFVPVDGKGVVPAVVVAFGRGGWDGPVKNVDRVATDQEIEDA